MTVSRTWVTRNLVVLSGVSFLQDAATELLYPVLPIFLTAVLGAPVAVVGLVEGLAASTAAAATVVSGRLADRIARRPLVGLGYGLAAAGKLLVALAVAWPVVLVGRAVDRLGKGVRGAPRDALLADGVPAAALGRAFGLHRTADTLGAVVGPLVGLAAYLALDRQIRPLLWVAVVPAVLSVLLVAAVREAPRAVATTRSPATGRSGGHARLPARFRRTVLVLGLFGLVNFPDALLLLRAAELGMTLPAVILAYVVYNLAYAGLSLPAGALADRWPHSRVYALGLACFAVGYLGLGLAEGPAAVWPLLVVYGGFAGCTDAVGKAWVSSLVPQRMRGSAQGVFQGVTGAGVLIAGVWAGTAWSLGPGRGVVPLLVSGAVAVAVAVLLLAAGDALEPRPVPGGPGLAG